MARKRRKRKPAPAATPGGPSKRRLPRAVPLLMAAVALALASFLFLRDGLGRQGVAVPDPDLSAMEPQVAAKIAEAREAVLASPDSHEAWGRFGMVLQAHRLETEAEACYRRALELGPAEFRWHYLLAHTLRGTDLEGALAATEAAARLREDYAPNYVLRGQILEASNQNELALTEYHKAVSFDPGNAMAEFGLGRLYLVQGELEKAREHLFRARDLAEEASAIHGALAQLYRRMGDMESALRENRIASEVNETIPIGDPVHYAMRKESVSSSAQFRQAVDAEQAGDFETAESLYRELLRIRSDDATLHSRFGNVLAEQNKLDQAKEQYQRALELNPELASAHYGLGNMLNFEGDYDGAARHYRASLETRPHHVRTLVNLAGILAFQGEYDEAASLCRKALEEDPNGYGANFQLGQVLIQLGKFKEAIPLLKTALETSPDSGPAHLQLGIALVGVGAYADAMVHVERAGELGQKVPAPLVEELRRRASGP